MRLLEIGMGCSVHGGVNGLNTLSVRPASYLLPRSFSEAPGAMREAPQACYTAAESPPCEQGSMGHDYKGQMCAVWQGAGVL